MDNDRTRGERRYQTRRHIRRARRTEHLVTHGPRRHACDCAQRPDWRYRKVNAFACRCRGKRRGAPKLAGSLHKSAYMYRTPVLRRIWNTRLANAWLAAANANTLDDCELPSGPITGRRRGARIW